MSSHGRVTPQPPGRTPHRAGQRASGTTQPQAPQCLLARLRHDVCPGGEDMPPALPYSAPPARPCEAPAREAVTTDVRAAYRRCEEITWSQARNFSYGIRLLPPAKRHALAAVYALARRIDDIGDGTLPAPEKLAALEEAQGRPVRPHRRACRRQRPGADGAGRRGDPVRHPAGRVRRADRRLRRRRARGHLRDLRRPAALLPVRGGLHRAALARGVRHQRPRHRGAAGRLARRRAAAHQHPPRYPRGLRQRAGLLARRGPRAVRLRPRTPTPPPIPASASSPRLWSSRRTARAPGTPKGWR